jgi:hypothetical protein
VTKVHPPSTIVMVSSPGLGVILSVRYTNLMKLSATLTVSCLLFCTQARSQTLVYSVSYAETNASLRAHFANSSPFPARRSPGENLAMMRNTRKTEIYSVSLVDGKRTLLFSDEGMNLEIKATGAVSGAGKAYMAGVWREWRATPIPGPHSEAAIYEISLNGSRQFRRVLEAQPNQAPPLLNPQGTKAAFEMFVDGESVVSIYAVPEWKLLHTWDLTKVTQEHCPACMPQSYGWLAVGNRLFFQLSENGDEGSRNAGSGTYIVSEDGKDLRVISPEAGAFQLDGHVHAEFVERQFLGQLPDGSYLFQDYAIQKGRRLSDLEPFLVVARPDSKSSKAFRVKFSIGSGYLSSSGKYLAYIENWQTSDYRTERHLWVKDLQSGEEKELFAAPPPNPPASPEPNVSLSVLGWTND